MSKPQSKLQGLNSKIASDKNYRNRKAVFQYTGIEITNCYVTIMLSNQTCFCLDTTHFMAIKNW